MKDKEIIKMLNDISKMLKDNKNEQAIDFIKKKVIEIQLNDDATSRYIDDLINDLKWIVEK